MLLNLFYFLSFLAVLSALMVVFSKKPVHSVLYLVVTFFCISGHYILLNAQFIAVVNIIVYAGAIMVLFLYVLMLLNQNEEAEPHKSNLVKGAAIISGGLLLMVLLGSVRGAEGMLVGETGNMGSVKSLGRVMFTEFLLPFEIASVLLLTSMVGAVMIGKK